jgi:hypothetical protein
MKALLDSFKPGLKDKEISPLQFFGKHGISVALVL